MIIDHFRGGVFNRKVFRTLLLDYCVYSYPHLSNNLVSQMILNIKCNHT